MKKMMKILDIFRKKNKNTENDECIVSIKNDGPLLRILVGDFHVANLYREAGEYCLVYNKNFLKAGILPFNSLDTNSASMPKIDYVYRSSELWLPFSSRLPSPGRPDYERLLKKLGLTVDDDPLLILGKVGKVSISKSWKIELINKKVS